MRIFVNNELNELYNGLEITHGLLKPGGICSVISFHSLEDRIAKRTFHGIDMDAAFNQSISDQFRSKNSQNMLGKDELMQALKKKWLPLSKKVLEATVSEIAINPRARSAKLRAAQKLEDVH